MSSKKKLSKKLVNITSGSARDRQIGGSHYSQSKIQPIDFIVENGLDWFEGNAVKYITRHAYKNGKQDLEKAIHYLQMKIERDYPSD